MQKKNQNDYFQREFQEINNKEAKSKRKKNISENETSFHFTKKIKNLEVIPMKQKQKACQYLALASIE